MKKAYINWSSGKDASMALAKIQSEGIYSIEKLLTTVNKEFERVSMHGLHINLLKAQAKAIGIPLETIELGEQPSMEDYNLLIHQATEKLKSEEFYHSIFGDIFLEDLREYREKQLRKVGIKAVFPLWKEDTQKLIHEFIEKGFRAIIVCCNAELLDKSFCGREIDQAFINDLPKGVDPCGENGEFHTFCFDGPCFKHPVNFEKGEIVYRTYPAPSQEKEDYGFWYCDLKSK